MKVFFLLLLLTLTSTFASQNIYAEDITHPDIAGSVLNLLSNEASAAEQALRNNLKQNSVLAIAAIEGAVTREERNIATALREILREKIQSAGYFKLADEGLLEEILDLPDIFDKGMFSSKLAPHAGALAGASAIIYGRISRDKNIIAIALRADDTKTGSQLYNSDKTIPFLEASEASKQYLIENYSPDYRTPYIRFSGSMSLFNYDKNPSASNEYGLGLSLICDVLMNHSIIAEFNIRSPFSGWYSYDSALYEHNGSNYEISSEIKNTYTSSFAIGYGYIIRAFTEFYFRPVVKGGYLSMSYNYRHMNTSLFAEPLPTDNSGKVSDSCASPFAGFTVDLLYRYTSPVSWFFSAGYTWVFNVFNDSWITKTGRGSSFNTELSGYTISAGAVLYL